MIMRNLNTRIYSGVIVIVFALSVLSDYADAQAFGCGDREFCTLAELVADPANIYIVSDPDGAVEVKFGGFEITGIGGIVSDPTKIKVIPLADVPSRPGLRFEPIGDIWNIQADASGGLDDFAGEVGNWGFFVQSNSATPVEITGISYSVDALAGLQAFPGIVPCEFTPWPYQGVGEGGWTSGGVGAWAGFLYSELLVFSNWFLPSGVVSGTFPREATLAFAAQDTPQEIIRMDVGFEAQACDDSDTAYVQGADTRSIEVRTLLKKVLGDLNGDGRSDIVWRNSSTGQNWVYMMNDASIALSVGINTVPVLWEIVGTGDFNGDIHADILWRNSSTGQNWLYLMNGASIASSVGINTVSNPNWRVVGDGDYNGDGRSDILWRNAATGQNWLYLMNGANVLSSVGINTISDTNWQVAGGGDYNGDGKSDILWRNALTGQNWLYLMSGATIVSSVGVNTISNLDWQIVGNGDYNGDGKSDILWRNALTGQNWLYLMSGATIVSSVGVNTISNLDWQIVDNGDYNGDGKSDILWRNSSTGQNWMYLMNGAAIMNSIGVNTISDTAWEIVNTN